MPDAKHLFINYAGEDWVFAEWLARRLAAEGYLVWLDRLKLLGGESYPRDIDDAIKNRTFRLLAVLSRNSIHKPNPTKERTLALNLGRERHIDFLIPLNLDGLTPIEIDWMTNDLTFIPFHNNWQAGLIALLKKLVSVETPQEISTGRRLAALSYVEKRPLQPKTETLIANAAPVEEQPSSIYRIRLNRNIFATERRALQSNWPFYQLDDSTVFSFWLPPTDGPSVEDYEIRTLDKPSLENIATPNIVSALLRQTVHRRFMELGCRQTAEDRPQLYFSEGLLPDNKISYTSYTGRKTYVLAIGSRSMYVAGEKSTYYYHLCPVFRIRQDLHVPFALQLGARLYLTDTKGQPLPKRSTQSRRKKIAKTWFNHQWLARVSALYCFLTQSEPELVIPGGLDGQRIVIGPLLQATVPVRIDESDEEPITDIVDVNIEEDVDDPND